MALSSLCIVPSPPSGVRVSQNGLNSVLVSWTPPSDATFVTGYIIYYQAHGGESNSLLTVGSDTSATVPGLSLWETYNISVASNSEFFYQSSVRAARNHTRYIVPLGG